MRFGVAMLLIFGFIGITALGFSMANEGHGHSSCVAAASQSSDCPESANPLSLAEFHIGAFKNFLTITLNNFSGVLLLLLSLILISALGVPKNPQPAIANQPPEKAKILEGLFFSKKKLTRWLTLHETSPTKF